MRVKDDQLWTRQLSELDADELSRLFRDFLVSWGDAIPESVPVSEIRDAVGKAFEETEQTLGFVSVEWLSQMMMLLVQHWVYGDEMWESLSAWERRMVEQATVLKLAELQDQASETP